MLFSERKRLRQLREREAQGESFWTSKFAQPVRVKLLYAYRDAVRGDPSMYARARDILVTGRGQFTLGSNPAPVEDFLDYVGHCDDEMVMDVIEAMYAAIHDAGRTDDITNYMRGREFAEKVQEILRNHRISFDFEEGQMVPFASKELHQAVLEPALHLLHDTQFQKAELAYRNALDELAKGKPGDAITDAATALQEMLVALGCHGNALGPLLTSARSKGLLGAHDPLLTEVLAKAITWVNADRSNTGDAHKADAAAVDDAWFTVHVVGAIMVRLAGAPRSAASSRT